MVNISLNIQTSKKNEKETQGFTWDECVLFSSRGERAAFVLSKSRPSKAHLSTNWNSVKYNKPSLNVRG